MEKIGSDAQDGPDAATELKRIMMIGVLAALLLVVAVILDGPVSILAWLLLGTALLCIVYVVVASRILLLHFRSQAHKAGPHD